MAFGRQCLATCSCTPRRDHDKPIDLCGHSRARANRDFTHGESGAQLISSWPFIMSGCGTWGRVLRAETNSTAPTPRAAKGCESKSTTPGPKGPSKTPSASSSAASFDLYLDATTIEDAGGPSAASNTTVVRVVQPCGRLDARWLPRRLDKPPTKTCWMRLSIGWRN
jgi:hypothetical protein